MSEPQLAWARTGTRKSAAATRAAQDRANDAARKRFIADDLRNGKALGKKDGLAHEVDAAGRREPDEIEAGRRAIAGRGESVPGARVDARFEGAGGEHAHGATARVLDGEAKGRGHGHGERDRRAPGRRVGEGRGQGEAAHLATIIDADRARPGDDHAVEGGTGVARV